MVDGNDTIDGDALIDSLIGADGGDDNNVSDPSSDPIPATELMVNGKMYTVEEIQRLEVKGKNFERDYNRKTESLAADRRVMDAENAKVNQRALAIQTAKAEDVNWYGTHDVGEWAGYTSKLDNLVLDGGGQKPTTVTGSTGMSEETIQKLVDAKVGTVIGDLEGVKAEMLRRDAKDSVSYADSLAATYPLADMEGVRDKMQIFYSTNKRVPTQKEVVGIVKASHDRVLNIPVVKESRRRLSKLPGAAGGRTPFVPPEKPLNLHDIAGINKLGASFMADRESGRKT